MNWKCFVDFDNNTKYFNTVNNMIYITLLYSTHVSNAFLNATGCVNTLHDVITSRTCTTFL